MSRTRAGTAGPKPRGGGRHSPSGAGRGPKDHSSKAKPLFVNNAQARKVLAVYWFLGICCLAALYGGWTIFTSFGLSPGDGGVLRPLPQRLAFGGHVAGLGLAIFLAMRLYAGLYVTRLERSEDMVGVQTMTLTGRKWRTIPAADFDLGKLRGENRFLTPRGHSVHAPWRTLRVKGRKLPLILDMKAEYIDLKALADLSSARPID